MADSSHLFEADKVRIANEAKVRTALEHPDFAQREFEKWQAEKDLSLRAESFATAWAKIAWLAEGRMHAMGRELEKLQQRIGRQRKANRRQHHVLKVAHERIEQLERVARRFTEYLTYLECECDSYVGFECSLHHDRILVEAALSDLKTEEEV